MREVNRIYDEESNRTWVERECPECGGGNITPMEKQQDGIQSLCYYLCEECGHHPTELFVYAYDGNHTLREVQPDPNFTLHTF